MPVKKKYSSKKLEISSESEDIIKPIKKKSVKKKSPTSSSDTKPIKKKSVKKKSPSSSSDVKPIKKKSVKKKSPTSSSDVKPIKKKSVKKKSVKKKSPTSSSDAKPIKKKSVKVIKSIKKLSPDSENIVKPTKKKSPTSSSDVKPIKKKSVKVIKSIKKLSPDSENIVKPTKKKSPTSSSDVKPDSKPSDVKPDSKPSDVKPAVISEDIHIVKIKSSSSEDKLIDKDKKFKAKILHSYKKEEKEDIVIIKLNNGGKLATFPQKVEEKSYFEVAKDYIFNIDLASIRTFLKALKGDVNLYPQIKGNLKEAGLISMKKYEDFMDAPTDPIISNISLGFLRDFIPKFKMLLINLTRIGGSNLASGFLDDIGFTETKLLKILKVGKNAKEQVKIIAKVFLQMSNPLCWVMIITNIIRSGYDIYKYFDNGGIIGKLGLIKETEGIENKIRSWSDKVLRTTISSMLDDLTSVIEDEDNRRSSNKILKLLFLGTGTTKAVQIKEEKVESYLEPVLKKIRIITKPINKQVGNVVSELSAQSLDYLINVKYDFKVEDLFPDENLRLLDQEEHDIEDEKSVRWALQEMGGLSSILMTHLLASYVTTIKGMDYDPSLLLTTEVNTSLISNIMRKMVSSFK